MTGQSYTTGPLEAGEYPYFCMVHPWMEGLVIVTNDHSATTSEPEPEPEPTPTQTTTSTSANTVENADGSSVPGCEPDCFIPSTVTIGVGGQEHLLTMTQQHILQQLELVQMDQVVHGPCLLYTSPSPRA